MGLLPQTVTENLQTMRQAVPLPGATFSSPISPSTGGGGGWDGPAGRPMGLMEQLQSYNGWNFVTVNRIAEEAGRVAPLVGVVRRSGGQEGTERPSRQTVFHRTFYSQSVGDSQEIKPLDSHIFLDLMKAPNPYDDWSSFAEEYHLFYELTGRAFIWWLPGQFGGLPSQMWVVPPQCIQAVPDGRNRGQIKSWTIRSEYYGTVDVPYEQVVWRIQKSPLGKQFSTSTTEAIAPWIRQGMTIDDARIASFQNEIKPDIWIELDPEIYPKADAKVLKEVRERIMQQSAGAYARGGARVKPPGTTLQRMDRAPSEMDFPESANQIRDGIGAARNVNRFKMGVVEDLNRATAQTAVEVFADGKLNPILAKHAGLLTKIVKRFDPSLVVYFPDQVPANDEEWRAESEMLFGMGAKTPDELRIDAGLKPFRIAGVTDVPYMKAGFSPAMLPEPTGDNPDDSDELATDEEDAKKKADGDEEDAADESKKKNDGKSADKKKDDSEDGDAGDE